MNSSRRANTRHEPRNTVEVTAAESRGSRTYASGRTSPSPWGLLLASLAVITATARADVLAGGDYIVSAQAINGGGRTMANGDYSLTGTAGQPAAGALAGGDYRLDGGFWSMTSQLPIEGGPTLRLVLAQDGLTLSWAPATDGFVLQQTDALGTTWQSVPGGTENPIKVPLGPGARYFRLIKP